MTIAPSNAASRVSPFLGRSICLAWNSMGAAYLNGSARSRFVLEIHMQSADRALVNAWIERAAQRQTVLDRQSLRVLTSQANDLLHIDLMEDNSDARIAAITLIDTPSGAVRQPLYAQTTLLRKSGFNAGSYDAPQLIRA